MLLCILPAPLLAQRYSFRHYGQEDGLSNPNLRSIAQDGTGYIWAGTRRGLFRYDGERFREFQGSSPLPSRVIRTLKTAPDGSLWVASGRGLTRIIGDRADNVQLPEAIDNSADGGLAIDSHGVVYMASNAGVLVVRNANTPKPRADFLAGTPRAPIFGVHVTVDGSLWIAAGSGLMRINAASGPPSGSTLSPQLGVPPDHWESIASDRDGAVWIRSLNHLMALPAGAQQFEFRDRGLPESGTTAALSVDSKGQIYVPTDSGLAFRDPETKQWKLVSSKQGLLSDSITCMLQDREQSVWLGLNGGGIARWLGFGEWAYWTRHEGLADDVVWAIQRTPRGELLVGTEGGLTLLPIDVGTSRTWTEHDGLSGNHVRAMRYDDAGNLWIVSAPGGLSVMDQRTGRIRAIGKEAGLDARSAFTLAFARGHLWVGTSAGIYRGDFPDDDIHKPVLFQRVHLPGEDPFESITTLAVDPKQRLWAAGSRGLAFWNGQSWTRPLADDTQGGEFLAVASVENEVWAGTGGNGLTRIWEELGRFRFQHFDTSSGLASNTVYVIGADSSGSVWVGTDAGVDIFRRKQAIPGAPGAWSHIGAAAGLAWNDTDAGAFLAEPSGTVWIGTSRGLSRFQPSDLEPIAQTPVVVVTATDDKHQPLRPDQLDQRPRSGRSIGFHYSALTYRNETDVRFQYRLAPLDAAWLETDQRSIFFPALPSGKYTFEVRARNPEGNWSEPQRVAFRVLAPWWKNLWTLAVALAVVALLIRHIFQFRMRRLLEAKRDLEEAVSARTQELEREKSELMVARELLADKATRDSLTGLWNRAAILEILERELHRTRRGERPVAIMLADLDHFKNINDSHGHPGGDAVLIDTARKIAINMRSYDSAGRYGGEEFLLVLSNCSHAAVLGRAEELRRAIDCGTVRLSGMELAITCSVGVAVSIGDTSIQDLIQQADDALYRAKREGRNRVRAAFSIDPLTTPDANVSKLALALQPSAEMVSGNGVPGNGVMDRADA